MSVHRPIKSLLVLALVLAAVAVLVATQIGGAAALGLLNASRVSATPGATPTASGTNSPCGPMLRSLSPRERHYVVAIMSLTYTQLGAAFGTKEVHVRARPIDSCATAR